MVADATLVPVERIQNLIYLIRGQKILLDRDLAALYGVETRVLNQAVRRIRARFPGDFLFALTRPEILELMNRSSPVRPSANREIGFHAIPRLRVPRLKAKKF
jgi:hypothetical protein